MLRLIVHSAGPLPVEPNHWPPHPQCPNWCDQYRHLPAQSLPLQCQRCRSIPTPTPTPPPMCPSWCPPYLQPGQQVSGCEHCDKKPTLPPQPECRFTEDCYVGNNKCAFIADITCECKAGKCESSYAWPCPSCCDQGCDHGFCALPRCTKTSPPPPPPMCPNWCASYLERGIQIRECEQCQQPPCPSCCPYCRLRACGFPKCRNPTRPPPPPQLECRRREDCYGLDSSGKPKKCQGLMDIGCDCENGKCIMSSGWPCPQSCHWTMHACQQPACAQCHHCVEKPAPPLPSLPQPECRQTADCFDYDARGRRNKCEGIMDVGCKCEDGKCKISGGLPWPRPRPECPSCTFFTPKKCEACKMTESPGRRRRRRHG